MDCAIHNPYVQNDPQFDVVLSGLGIEPEQKVLVFLTICIVVRLLIAGVANVYHDTKVLPYVAAVIGIAAMVIIGSNIDQDVWWSRKMHLVIATMIVLSSGYQITSGVRDRSIAYLLYADVLLGLSTFAYTYVSC